MIILSCSSRMQPHLRTYTTTQHAAIKCTNVVDGICLQIFQSCPAGSIDFRSEQCKTFGEDLTPFVNKSDPCKLLCSSLGQSPIQKGLVVDGTSCSSDGVCVSGECVVSKEHLTDFTSSSY